MADLFKSLPETSELGFQILGVRVMLHFLAALDKLTRSFDRLGPCVSGSPAGAAPVFASTPLLGVPSWPEAQSCSSPESSSAPCSRAEWISETQSAGYLCRQSLPSSTVPPAAGYPMSVPQCMAPAGSSQSFCPAVIGTSAARP